MKIKAPHVSWFVVALAIGIIVVDVAMLVFRIPWSGKEEYLRSLVGETITISGTVVEDPDTSESKTTCRLKTTSGTVYVSGGVNREIRRSDTVTINGKMSEGFGTFAGTFYRPKVLKIERGEDIFLETRDFFAEKIREVIPEKEAALGLGYLLGVRSSLPEGLSETLKVVGLTHIIVASGANLSILISFSRKVFGKVSRFFGVVVSLALVLFYVGMVGLSPSMVRAGIVSVLSLITWYVGRKFAPWRLLLLTAAATLVYNPMYLIDLGWLLSFGSFAGVMIVGPRLLKFFYGEKEPGIIGATIIETLAASLVCTPILLYFFGSISLISLLANVLVLPTISAAMALCFATGVFGMLGVSVLAGAIGQVATWLLSYHLAVIEFFGQQTSFVVTIPTGQAAVFLLYLPLLFLIKYPAAKTEDLIGVGGDLLAMSDDDDDFVLGVGEVLE